MVSRYNNHWERDGDGDYVEYKDYAAMLESHRELLEHTKKLIALANKLQSNGGIIGWTSDHVIDEAEKAIARAEGIG